MKKTTRTTLITALSLIVGIIIGLSLSDRSFDFFTHQNGEIHDPDNLIGQSFQVNGGKKYYSGYVKRSRGFLQRNQFTFFVSETEFMDHDKVCFGGENNSKLVFTNSSGDSKEVEVSVITNLLKKGECVHDVQPSNN